MRVVLILSLVAFGFLALTMPSKAHAAVICDPATTLGCLEQGCSIVGQSKMNMEKTHILVCLCPSSGTCYTSGVNMNLIWKSNTTSAELTCGSLGGDWDTTTAKCGFIKNATCIDQVVDGGQTSTAYCPSGFSMVTGGCDIYQTLDPVAGNEDVTRSYQIPNGWFCGSSSALRKIRSYVHCCR